MSGRRETWSGFAIPLGSGMPVAPLHDWGLLAAHHSNHRNETVVKVLVFAAVARQMRRFAAEYIGATLLPDAAAYDDGTIDGPPAAADDAVTTAGAAWQTPAGPLPALAVPPAWQARLDELLPTGGGRERFVQKATSWANAHCVPCAIRLGITPLEEVIRQGMTVGDAVALVSPRVPFGRIDPLPLVFNEADSHAERVGLKQALRSACEALPSGLSSPSGVQLHERVARGYHRWRTAAVAALDETIARNRERLAQAEASGDPYRRLYREARIAILQGYRDETDTVVPDDLQTPALVSRLYDFTADLLRAAT